MSLVFDEYGRPYVIIRDQEQKSRLKGLDAQKVRQVSPLPAPSSVFPPLFPPLLAPLPRVPHPPPAYADPVPTFRRPTSSPHGR
jgi:hypothetical protein